MSVEEGCLTDHLADSTEDVKLIRDEVRLHGDPPPLRLHPTKFDSAAYEYSSRLSRYCKSIHPLYVWKLLTNIDGSLDCRTLDFHVILIITTSSSHQEASFRDNRCCPRRPSNLR